MEIVDYYHTIISKVALMQKEIYSVMPKVKEIIEIQISDILKDKELLRVVEKLYNDGHHARAVEEAFKLLNNLVKSTVKLKPELDGSSLMKKAFSANSPILMINSGESQSEKDEQLGYMEIFSGVMTGIRNPRAHEHDWEDTQKRAMELITLADHLIEKVKFAKQKNPKENA